MNRKTRTTPAPPPDASRLWPVLVLALLVLAVYAQTLGHAFVHWDDGEYVFENPAVKGGLSLAAVKWALTAFHAGTWMPITWLSYLADVSIHGLRPVGFHATNVLLHLLNVILLYLLLRRLTKAAGLCFWAAALYAVHPLNAEAVAWVADRKDLLAAPFLWLSIGAYLRWVERPGPGRYLGILLLYALALMCKPVVMTFPVLLLLLDIWPLRRPPDWGRRLWEKLPFFGLSVASLAVTYAAQRQAGAVSSFAEIPLSLRLANALTSCARYLGDVVWPLRLAAFYPFMRPQAGWIAVAVLVLGVATWLAWRARRRQPALLTGWLWYLVALVPSIGLVQIGSHARADRFLYIPLVGVVLAAVWGVHAAVPPARRRALAVAGSVVLLGLAALGFRQAAFWKNDETLFGRALAVTRGNYLAHNKLGTALGERGRLEEAHGHFVEALAIQPTYLDALYNLGAVADRLGRSEEAISAYRRALDINPHEERARRGLAAAWNNLGSTEAEHGNPQQAVAHFEEALQIDPGYRTARWNLVRACLGTRDTLRAREEFARALKVDPNPPPDLRRLARSGAPR
jgi:protein O-mannosyl-transferase